VKTIHIHRKHTHHQYFFLIADKMTVLLRWAASAEKQKPTTTSFPRATFKLIF